MNSRNDILQELKALNSSLPADFSTPVFTVPNDYFENFAASVIQRIKKDENIAATDELEELSPLLAGISRKMPFAVPHEYFDNLSTSAISSEEEMVPAILQQAGKKMPFTVPNDYFDNLPQQILSKVSTQEAKVVSITEKSAARPLRWMRMAAAAAVIGIICFTAILYFQTENATIDPDKNSEAWVEKKLKNVSNKELENFIQSTDVNAHNNGVANNVSNSKEVRKLLQDVSNSELDAFLSQMPTDNNEIIFN